MIIKIISSFIVIRCKWLVRKVNSLFINLSLIFISMNQPIFGFSTWDCHHLLWCTFQTSSLSYNYSHKNMLSLEVTIGLLLWGLCRHHLSVVTMAHWLAAKRPPISPDTPMNLTVTMKWGSPLASSESPASYTLSSEGFLYQRHQWTFFVHALALNGDLVKEFGERIELE